MNTRFTSGGLVSLVKAQSHTQEERLLMALALIESLGIEPGPPAFWNSIREAQAYLTAALGASKES